LSYWWTKRKTNPIFDQSLDQVFVDFARNLLAVKRMRDVVDGFGAEKSNEIAEVFEQFNRQLK
jgi:hypothetical protein